MGFEDLFNTMFLQKSAAFSLTDMLIALTFALLAGIFIYLIYRKTFCGVIYSRPFNISLVLLTMITTLIILAVTSNVVIALGMVGALSIVRFRTPIKDPMDLVFLFWAIGAGIIIGAGLIPLAIIGSVLIGVIMVFFASRNAFETPYIVMINCNGDDSESKALTLVGKIFPRYRVKSKTVTAGKGTELILEVRMKNAKSDFINNLSAITGVTNASLVSYSGEYAS